MEFYDWLKKYNLINGMGRKNLQTILEGTHPSIWAEAQGNVVILRKRSSAADDDPTIPNPIFKCVRHYYATKDGDVVKVKKSKNPYADCLAVRKGLGIEYVSSGDCVRCHANCLSKLKEHELTNR